MTEGTKMTVERKSGRVDPFGESGGRPHHLGFLSVLLSCASLVTLFACSTAYAEFSQPSLCQISPSKVATEDKTQRGSEFEPRSLAIGPKDELWVGVTYEKELKSGLDKFNLCTFSGEVLETNSRTIPSSLAVNNAAELFYVTGELTTDSFAPFLEVFDKTGKLLNTVFAPGNEFGKPTHAVVNESASILYVAHGFPNPAPPAGDGLSAGIEKYEVPILAGLPKAVNFEYTPPSGQFKYIEGNQIFGTPSRSFSEEGEHPRGIATDGNGDIYAVSAEEVDEYASSGQFLHAFTGAETPGLGESHEHGGFGGSAEGVAVDPASGLVAVSVRNFKEGEGAVDEFNPVSGKFVHQITGFETSVGVNNLLNSAFNVQFDSHGDLYLEDSGSEKTSKDTVDVYGPGRFVPSFKAAPVTDRTATSAVVNGLVNSEGFPLGECYFEYVDDGEYEPDSVDPFAAAAKAPCVPGTAEIPADEEYHAVHAEILGLVSGVKYHYRVVATNTGTLGGAAFGPPSEFTAPSAPAVESTTVTNISSSFADLQAEIDPSGADTTYKFEYVEDARFQPLAEDPYAAGATAPIAEEVDIGAGGPTGSAFVKVVQQVGNLLPDTIYHLRVVATNNFTDAFGNREIGVSDGPDVTFVTVPRSPAGLSDSRAYELVTPPNKGSAGDMFGAFELERNKFYNQDVGYPSENGERFIFETRAAFGPFPAMEDSSSFPSAGHNVYVFTRSEMGKTWTTTPLASASLGVQTVFAGAFDPATLSEVAISDGVGAEEGASGIHRVTLLASLDQSSSGPVFAQIHSDREQSDNSQVVGASHDMSHIVLESEDHTLAAGDEEQDPKTPALYDVAGGNIALVNVGTNGSLLSKCGALLGLNTDAGNRHNAVSASGSGIVFTAPDPKIKGMTGCWDGQTLNTPQLYVRSGGVVTSQISAPEDGVTEEGSLEPEERPVQRPALYVGASDDGSKVFFITETELTPEASTLKLHDPELYEYDAVTKALTRVSAGEPALPVREFGTKGSEVFTVPSVAADGAAVYFTAFGQLTSTAPVVKGEEVDLYRYDTLTGVIVYVATVSERDYPSTSTGRWWQGSRLPAELALTSEANWYTTPDGQYLLFASTNELKSGYGTVETDPGDCPTLDTGLAVGAANGHCYEIYRYNAATGVVTCVSCDPSGAAPRSNAFFGHSAGLDMATAGPVAAMSNDGTVVLFATADSLVPQDSNGTLDVYEWHNGAVALISSGTDFAPSYFLGTSAAVIDGAKTEAANVFFGTHAQLASQDRDAAGDLYDARVDGGFSSPPPKGGVCEGDACQNPPPTPIDVTPVSLTFVGPGNITDVTGRTPVKRPALTSAQRLAKALKTCKKLHKSRRTRCEKKARRLYGKSAKRSSRYLLKTVRRAKK